MAQRIPAYYVIKATKTGRPVESVSILEPLATEPGEDLGEDIVSGNVPTFVVEAFAEGMLPAGQSESARGIRVSCVPCQIATGVV